MSSLNELRETKAKLDALLKWAVSVPGGGTFESIAPHVTNAIQALMYNVQKSTQEVSHGTQELCNKISTLETRVNDVEALWHEKRYKRIPTECEKLAIAPATETTEPKEPRKRLSCPPQTATVSYFKGVPLAAHTMRTMASPLTSPAMSPLKPSSPSFNSPLKLSPGEFPAGSPTSAVSTQSRDSPLAAKPVHQDAQRAVSPPPTSLFAQASPPAENSLFPVSKPTTSLFAVQQSTSPSSPASPTATTLFAPTVSPLSTSPAHAPLNTGACSLPIQGPASPTGIHGPSPQPLTTQPVPAGTLNFPSPASPSFSPPGPAPAVGAVGQEPPKDGDDSDDWWE